VQQINKQPVRLYSSFDLTPSIKVGEDFLAIKDSFPVKNDQEDDNNNTNNDMTQQDNFVDDDKKQHLRTKTQKSLKVKKNENEMSFNGQNESFNIAKNSDPNRIISNESDNGLKDQLLNKDFSKVNENMPKHLPSNDKVLLREEFQKTFEQIFE